MHILETYALISGAKINKCYIKEKIINIPHKNYIVFHPECNKASARQYNRWDEVLQLLINDETIISPIIQIGSILDKKYSMVDTSLLGKTTVNELAYIIKNSTLFVGYDSFPMHLASHYDKKIVSLFSYYSKNSRPYFSSNENTILIEPDFTKHKPSFSYNDRFDLINTISPDIIYYGIKQLL